MKISHVLYCVFLALILSTNTAFTAGKPNWLANGLYMTYEQFFVWPNHSETHNMTWQITRIEGDNVDVRTTSYTLNSSDSTLSLIPVASDDTVNVETRNIVSSSEPNLIGLKWPFWVETNINLGSEVNTYFGVATVSRSEVISVLGQERDTWVTEYSWPTSSMIRWYDKASGIVLKIDVALQRAGVQVQITETAKSTNVNLPPGEVPYSDSFAWIRTFAIAATLVVVIVVAAAWRWRASRHKLKNHS